ncbi:Serine/threonine-protein kinase STY8 [Cucurbita argyrosperma subsp. argyrosperma]|nr:Serine/threonine-protein kinase STY8 [Cucurbita argyrosperma subsp. argyrosperma]
MDFVEGVGESSSPPRSFGAFCGVHDIRNDVYTRLVESGHEEAASNPLFRENLDAHFNRLPPSYGLDVNMEKVEDVVLHQNLLSLAKDPEKCPVYHIRFLEVELPNIREKKLRMAHCDGLHQIAIGGTWRHICTKTDGNDDEELDSILLSGSSNEAADKSFPVSHKRIRGNILDFEPCSKLEDLKLDVRKNSKAMDGRYHMESFSKRQGISHVPVHEVIFSTVDKPKLLSQLSALLSDIGLNIREAHVFSTSDGYSLDVFVVDGWPAEVTAK